MWTMPVRKPARAIAGLAYAWAGFAVMWRSG